nr:choice-of-anchor A family protein [Kiritimatiellia bacterium]
MKNVQTRLVVWISLFASLCLPSLADVEVFKSIKNGLTLVDSGQVFTYRLQYRAASTTTDFFNASMTDVLPEGLEFVSLNGTVHVDSFNYDPTGRELTIQFVDPLPAGSTGDIEVNVRFSKGSTPDGAVAVNTATIDADNSPPDTSDPVTITARAQNKASVVKDLLGSSVPLDQNVTYRVRLVNSSDIGALNLSGITVVDSLPAGAEYVDSSHSGIYDAVEHTVTWSAASLNVNSTLSRTVTVNYPVSEFVLGDTVTNQVAITYTPLGEPETTGEDDVTHTIVAPQGAHGFTKSVSNNYVYDGKAAWKTWTFSLENKGNVPMENVVVTDAIPPQLEVTHIRTGESVGTPSGLHDDVSVFYKTNLNPGWSSLPGTPYPGDDSERVSVGDLSLGAGEAVTEVKWEFGTIPVGYKVNDLRLETKVLTVDRTGDPVVEGDEIRNDAGLTYIDYRGTITDDDDDDIDIRSPRPVVNLIKNASSTTVDDGESTTYELILQNNSLAARDLENPVLADLLDEKLVYVPGSFSVVSKPAGAPDPVFELISDYNGTGRTLLRWSWNGSAAYDLPIGKEIKLTFDVEVPAGTIYGTIGNKLYLVDYDNDVIDRISTGEESDSLDLDDDGDTTEKHPVQNRNIFVRGRASMDSVKWVKGELDDIWHKFPDSGMTVPGGQADYRLIVKNTGNVPMHDTVILDILPIIGDTGVIDLSQRDTEWIAALAGPVTAPSGVTVFYSRSSNPHRPDFDSDGPVGAIPPEWSTIPPATITDVRSLLFVFDTIVIQPAEEFELTWPMRAPVGTPTDGEIAWNSFGYYGTREDTGTDLLPSEPIKVGIAIEPDNNAAYGDRVWLDTNKDGIQDPGEQGINGILVYLYEDSGPGLFGDGVANPADDRLVGFTVTSNNHLGEPGYYLFPDLDRGNYYAVFDIPDTYTVSPFQAVGSNAANDSDGDPVTGITPITDIAEFEVDLSWDLGLWLPPSSVSIVKTAGTAADGDTFWTEPNTPVSYTYTVTNTGDLPLVRIRVTDDKLGQVALLDGPIEPGASVVLTKTSAPLANGVVNIGDVEAYPADPDTKLEIPGGKAVTDDDPADVRLYASIGNFIWYDLDFDGILDSGEPGVKDVVVTLYDDGGNAITSQTTGTNGKYVFNGLFPGDYSVGFEPPADYIFVHQNEGSNAAKDSDADLLTGKTVVTTLDEGEQDLTWDAGVWKTASLGDYVWWDFDPNGIQDSGEPGVNGITVNLLDAAGDPVLDRNGLPISTVTANGPGGDGYYILDDLVPGVPYRVEFVPSPGLVFTLQDADGNGINGSKNSDADTTTGITDVVTLGNGEHNPRIDAGILGDPEIELIKNVDKVQYSVDGETLTYSFTVTNTGNVPLSNVTVSDPLFPVQGGPISLAVGQSDSTTFTGSYNVNLADLNAGSRPNTASTSGTFDVTGEVVNDTDDVTVPALQLPELTLTKTGTYRSSASGVCDSMGWAGNFNALIFGNFSANGGDTEGRLAVGGNSHIPSGYSVGLPVYGLPIPTNFGDGTDMYIVGGDLSDGVWGVNGNVVFAGTRTGPFRYQPNGNVTRQVIPVTFDANGNVPSAGNGSSFDDLRALLQARSALFAALDDRGVAGVDDSEPFKVVLVGNDNHLNVFNVTAGLWSNNSTEYHIHAPAGSTVLVNIHGSSVEIHNGRIVLHGIDNQHVLYNYVDAESVTTSGFTHEGSVFAPYADGDFSGGSINGHAVFGGNVTSANGFEFHNYPFAGNICVEVVYEFTVTNVGNVTITDIQVDDPVVPVDGGPISSMDPGESDGTTFTAVYAIQPEDILTGSFTNTAMTSGDAPPSHGGQAVANASD